MRFRPPSGGDSGAHLSFPGPRSGVGSVLTLCRAAFVQGNRHDLLRGEDSLQSHIPLMLGVLTTPGWPAADPALCTDPARSCVSYEQEQFPPSPSSSHAPGGLCTTVPPTQAPIHPTDSFFPAPYPRCTALLTALKLAVTCLGLPNHASNFNGTQAKSHVTHDVSCHTVGTWRAWANKGHEQDCEAPCDATVLCCGPSTSSLRIHRSGAEPQALGLLSPSRAWPTSPVDPPANGSWRNAPFAQTLPWFLLFPSMKT